MPKAGKFASNPARLIDAEAERLLLSNILTRPEFSTTTLPQLSSDYFAVDRHRRVFQLLIDAAEHGHEPGLSGAYRFMLDSGKTPEDLGLPLLSDLAFTDTLELPTAAPWVNALKRKSAERRAWRLAERMRLGLEAGTENADELAAIREELRKVETDLQPAAPSSGTIADSLAEIGIDNLLSEPHGVIATPYPRLTGLTNGGPRPGELWIVGARPSVGKTTFSLQLALSAASAGQRTILFTLEMPSSDIQKRVLSNEGNIPHSRLVAGDLDSSWRFRVAATIDRIGHWPLEVTDKFRTLPAIIAKIAATPNLGLAIIDYLGLIEVGGRYENRNQEVSAISRRLKIAAMDCGLPIVAAHQLNRSNENETRPPRLSDLRDSGSIEQDADTVLLLDSPAGRKHSDSPKDAIHLALAKQRNGPKGFTVNLRSEFNFCRMVQDADGEND